MYSRVCVCLRVHVLYTSPVYACVCERVYVCLHLYVLYTIPLCACMCVRYTYAILFPRMRATHAVLMRICMCAFTCVCCVCMLYYSHVCVGCVCMCVCMYAIIFTCMHLRVHVRRTLCVLCITLYYCHVSTGACVGVRVRAACGVRMLYYSNVCVRSVYVRRAVYVC